MRPRLHVIALSHLDTQWRWTVRETARRYLPDTVRANEDRFRRFPSYLLSFEGAIRYRLLADCHPDLFAQVRQRVGEGRWFPAGAAWEAFDANLPAPESILRQVLTGTRWFEQRLGTSGRDLFLPDCFGFGWALPTLAAHAGLIGFSTQKLRRGALMRSAFGVPFPLGRWIGPDGSELLAMLDPGEYGAQASHDLATDAAWIARFRELEDDGHPPVLATYQGLGDRGGALPASALAWLERSVASNGPIEVAISPSERVFAELSPGDRERLPVYRGELLLTLHAPGCYTSRGELKAWHRQAERLADVAERAAALAHLRGARPYPGDRLRECWHRILAHQMHDDLTGTSVPAAYRHTAAELALALNELARIAADSVGALGGSRKTGTGSEALLVFNSLPYPREELVPIAWPGNEDAPPRVVDAEGARVPGQWRRSGSGWRGWVLARVPALDIALLRVQGGSGERDEIEREATAPPRSAANGRYRLELDASGDLAALFDQRLDRELLGGPAGLEILANRSTYFPAWEIHYADIARAPRTRVSSVESVRWLEHGPLRAALEVVRTAEGSRFRQVVALASGGGADWVEIEQEIDWRSDAALLKAAFRVPWESPDALYDLGVGAIARPVSSPRLYEVPAQQWAALLDAGGAGLGVLSESKQGWDHPAPDQLRLTLLHTPQVGRRLRYQHRQDFGRHRVRYALAGVAGPSPSADLARLAERFRLPLLPFWAGERGDVRSSHRGALALGSADFELMALKRAEEGDRLVVRLRETAGRSSTARLDLAPGLTLQRRLDGLERPLERDGAAPLEVPGFGLATFEIVAEDEAPACRRTPAVALPHDLRGVTDPGEKGPGFDGRGRAFARQLLPSVLEVEGLTFELPEGARQAANATRCRGQWLEIPAGAASLVLLGASTGGAMGAEFRVGERAVWRRIEDWSKPLGRFQEPYRWPWGYALRAVRSGWLETAPLLFAAAHRHDRRGRVDPCRSAQLFGIELPLEGRATRVQLPRAPRLRLLAATLSAEPWPNARPAVPLFV